MADFVSVKAKGSLFAPTLAASWKEPKDRDEHELQKVDLLLK